MTVNTTVPSPLSEPHARLFTSSTMTVDVDTVTVPTVVNGKAGVALPVNAAAELAAQPPPTSGPPPVPMLTSRTLLDEHLASRPTTDLPAIFFAATNAEETLYLNQAGDRVFGRPEEGAVNSDTRKWSLPLDKQNTHALAVELFSQTKVVTCVSVLLLVDRGLISLDDPADIEKYLPELSTCQILTGYDEAGDGVLVPPERKITARMLCSHSSGEQTLWKASLTFKVSSIPAASLSSRTTARAIPSRQPSPTLAVPRCW